MFLGKVVFPQCRTVLSNASRASAQPAFRHFSLSKALPSKISAKATISKHKQAFMNVGFSFLTCILGAQVLRMRYDVENNEEERDELRKAAQDIFRSIHASRLEKLCKDMDASPLQCKAIENYVASVRTLIPGDHEAFENIVQEEISKEKAADERTENKSKVKNFVV